MNRREILAFRTPQHPSLGSNNWGGASPLLARNIPKESLEQRYANLNSIQTRDEIFRARDSDFFYMSNTPMVEKPSRRSFMSKLFFQWRGKPVAVLGSSTKKKRWFPRWDPQNRWPQGW